MAFCTVLYNHYTRLYFEAKTISFCKTTELQSTEIYYMYDMNQIIQNTMVSDGVCCQGLKTCPLYIGSCFGLPGPGARPTKHISIEFEIRGKFKTLHCKIYAVDHNDILHTSRQCLCRDVCKYRCDRSNIFETRAFWIFIEFRIRSKYALWRGRGRGRAPRPC